MFTTQPDCNFCGLPIRGGLEVTVHKTKFHPGCAVKAIQAAKSLDQHGNNRCTTWEDTDEIDDTERAESDETRVVSDPCATVH